MFYSVSSLLNTSFSCTLSEVEILGDESIRFDGDSFGLLDWHVDGHLLILGSGHGDVRLVVISFSINRSFGLGSGISIDISISVNIGISNSLNFGGDVGQDGGVEVFLGVVQRDSVNGSSSNKSSEESEFHFKTLLFL